MRLERVIAEIELYPKVEKYDQMFYNYVIDPTLQYV
jgi:hypothetical protein